jgi:hypothetical protein
MFSINIVRALCSSLILLDFPNVIKLFDTIQFISFYRPMSCLKNIFSSLRCPFLSLLSLISIAKRTSNILLAVLWLWNLVSHPNGKKPVVGN